MARSINAATTEDTAAATTEETAEVPAEEKLTEVEVLFTSAREVQTTITALLMAKEGSKRRVVKLRKQSDKARDAGRHAHAQERDDLADMTESQINGRYDPLVERLNEAATKLA